MSKVRGEWHPQRTCQACRVRKSRTQLLRLVVAESSKGMQVVWDKDKVLPGRGVWICGAQCLALALKKRILNRAFKVTMELGLGDLDLSC